MTEPSPNDRAMTDQQHPITPSQETIAQLTSEALRGSKDQHTYEVRLITGAYRAGADAELEACCEWLDIPAEWETVARGYKESDQLRAARRPKPTSLAEEALDTLETKKLLCFDHPEGYNIIHRALKRLQELEQNNG